MAIVSPQTTQYSTAEEIYKQLPAIAEKLTAHGWRRLSAGESAKIDYNRRFDFYIRRRNLMSLMPPNDDSLKKSSNSANGSNEAEPCKTNVSKFDQGMVSNPTMGVYKMDLTPSEGRTNGDVVLPVLSGFDNYPCLWCGNGLRKRGTKCQGGFSLRYSVAVIGQGESYICRDGSWADMASDDGLIKLLGNPDKKNFKESDMQLDNFNIKAYGLVR